MPVDPSSKTKPKETECIHCPPPAFPLIGTTTCNKSSVEILLRLCLFKLVNLGNVLVLGLLGGQAPVDNLLPGLVLVFRLDMPRLLESKIYFNGRYPERRAGEGRKPKDIVGGIQEREEGREAHRNASEDARLGLFGKVLAQCDFV